MNPAPARDVLDYIIAAGAGAAVLAVLASFLVFISRLSMAVIDARLRALEAHDTSHDKEDKDRFERIEFKLDGLRDLMTGTTTTPRPR